MDEEKETKPKIEQKSSMEILSELFSTFHAEPPVLIKEELTKELKKNKKKKKHKHKDKKHKKKCKKRKRSQSRSDSEIEFDFSKLLVKKEQESDNNKIKIEGTDLSLSLNNIDVEISQEEDIKPCISELTEDLPEKSEEGEITSDDKHRKHKKHKSKHKHRSRSKSEHKENSDCEKKSKHRHRERSRSRDEFRSKKREENSFYKSRSRSPHRYSGEKDNSYKYDDDFYKPRERERSYDRDFYRRDRSFERNHDNNRWHNNKRLWDRKYRDRSWSLDKDSSSYIDKKKLLEIARKNAIQMMKSGNLPGALTLGPQAQEKVIAAIKAGGKTIEELTEFCKSLSKKEDLGELSDVDDDKACESDNDKPFNHPFQIKERPTTITMNIKNSVPLPTKSTQERTSELRMQFPVSSGQQHRKNEHEWVPVEPKKDIVANKPKEVPQVMVPPIVSPPKLVTTQPAVEVKLQPSLLPVDIGAIVSQRLSAMRKLQENPNDVQALTQMYKSTKEVQTWAESKQQPGQFTGSVAGNFLSQSELNSGYQAWAKKDQLQIAAPVSGGMGMHLLQKMGWKPGEGLGKEKTGALEPLLLEVKLDKKGLVANEETQKKKKIKQPTNPPVEGKHPVSLLGEYACKKKLGVPVYELCFECGPDHKKNFLFKVILNGIEFKPNVASPNKKEAKACAATLCLQKLGILSS